MYDDKLDTAIKVLDRNLTIIKQGSATDYTYVTTKSFTIFSCYCSPNDDIANLEVTLGEIARKIRGNKEKAIITGDFNSKSLQWGINYTDDRGMHCRK